MSKGSVQEKQEGAFSFFRGYEQEPWLQGPPRGPTCSKCGFVPWLYLKIEEYPCWDLQRPSNQAEQDHCMEPKIIYPGLDMLGDKGHVPYDS